MRAQVTQTLAREFERLFQVELEQWVSGRGEEACGRGRSRPPRPTPVSGRLVGDVLQAVAGLVLITTGQCPGQPVWVEAWPQSAGPAPADTATRADEGRWPVHEILPARNTLVHLPTLIAGGACAIAPTPRFFNAFALDYDILPDAPPPVEWLEFLDQIWERDAQSIACLQEWFGYLLTPDTHQQKILMMVGPKRSGWGTIARVLKTLAGASNVVNPTLSTLARPFGLSALIDKPVAIFPDARLSSRPDNATIVESLLSISGEDDQTIDRKHLPAWTGRLPTRFVLISNELPRLRDASGALASRLIILRFTRAFYNREDLGLFDRLVRELPGILLWAVAGWERLRQRGRFVQPRSGQELPAAMQDLGSPISAFLRDRCVLEPDGRVAVAVLYEVWRGWCQEHGRDAVGDEPSLGRDLHAAILGLSKSRFRDQGTRVAYYRGIRLRTSPDPDPDFPSMNWPGGGATEREPGRAFSSVPPREN
jgi:putative DNA primase/helicase